MIADELNKLKQTKAQIKQALIDKGQNPTDEFASYVGNIAGISSGEDPFLPLGYSIPQTILEAINYGYQLKQDVENGMIYFQKAMEGNSQNAMINYFTLLWSEEQYKDAILRLLRTITKMHVESCYPIFLWL